MIFKSVLIIFLIQLITCAISTIWGIAAELNNYYCIIYGENWKADEVSKEDIERSARVFTKSFLPMFNSSLKLMVITDLLIVIVLKLVF